MLSLVSWLILAGAAGILALSSLRKPWWWLTFWGPFLLLYFLKLNPEYSSLLFIYLTLVIGGLLGNIGMIPSPLPLQILLQLTGQAYACMPLAFYLFLVRNFDTFAGDIMSILLFPLSYTLLEVFSAPKQPFGTWGVTGYLQIDNPLWRPLTRFVGIFGLSFLSLAVPAALVVLLQPISITRIVFAATVSLLPWLLGLVLLRNSRKPSRTIQVAGITTEKSPLLHGQEVVELFGRPVDEEKRASVKAHCAQTIQRLCEHIQEEAVAGAELIIAAEAEAMVFAEDFTALQERATQLTQENGIYLLLPYLKLLPRPNAPQELVMENGALFFDASGKQRAQYIKRKPVPGFEQLNSAGQETPVPVIDTPLGKIAFLICFDNDFPELVAEAKSKGAEIVLAPASDWESIGHAHHTMSRTRALEFSVSYLRQARRGHSALISPFGEVLELSIHQEEGPTLLRGQLPVYQGPSVYNSTWARLLYPSPS